MLKRKAINFMKNWINTKDKECLFLSGWIVDYLKMHGIDFEEFLWGMGISGDMIGNLCGYLRSKAIVPES